MVKLKEMNLLNPNDVLEESWLLFFLTGLLGLGVKSACSHRGCIGWFYSCLLIALYFVLFFSTKEWSWNHYDSLRDGIFFFENQKLRSCFHLVVVPALLIASVTRSSVDFRVYKKLEDIDRNLSYLNSPVDHKLQMRRETAHLCIYVFLVLVMNLLTYFVIVTADCGSLFNFTWILNYFPTFVEAVIVAGFVTALRKISERFSKANEIIRKLLAPRKVSVILLRSINVNSALKLRLARRVHRQLHNAAELLNESYGFRLLLIFLITCFSILSHLRNALNLIKNPIGAVDLALHVIWIGFDVAKYLHVANVCRDTVKKSKMAEGIFIEASVSGETNGLNDEMEAFSRQLMNQKLQFTICGIVSFDFSKSMMIFILILIYFLVLV